MLVRQPQTNHDSHRERSFSTPPAGLLEAEEEAEAAQLTAGSQRSIDPRLAARPGTASSAAAYLRCSMCVYMRRVKYRRCSWSTGSSVNKAWMFIFYLIFTLISIDVPASLETGWQSPDSYQVAANERLLIICNFPVFLQLVSPATQQRSYTHVINQGSSSLLWFPIHCFKCQSFRFTEVFLTAPQAGSLPSPFMPDRASHSSYFH